MTRICVPEQLNSSQHCM